MCHTGGGLGDWLFETGKLVSGLEHASASAGRHIKKKHLRYRTSEPNLQEKNPVLLVSVF